MIKNEAYKRLSACGLRPSMQRLAIMDYLLTHSTHPTIDDIYKDLGKRIPSLSKTTLYNTLRMLAKGNAAQMLSIDDHRVCYDGDTRPHVHFMCDRCGKVIDIFDIPAPDKDSIGNIGGHLVTDAQLYYKGICAECLKSEEEDGAARKK